MRAKDAPAPTRTAIYLDGGAGGSSIANLTYFGAWTPSRALRALLVGRVLVAIDRRGTGGSQPRLDCPGLDVVPLPERPAESGLFCAEDVGQCRSRLVGEGVAPPAYGTEAAADDVEAVRQALHLGSYDLVGSAHGARVALEVLRRHPQGVRAVVLDSLTPPDVDALAEEGPSLERALGKAFAECAAIPACQTRFPDPAAALAEVVARLQADPVEASSHGGSATLDGRTFVQAVAALLRDGHPARRPGQAHRRCPRRRLQLLRRGADVAAHARRRGRVPVGRLRRADGRHLDRGHRDGGDGAVPGGAGGADQPLRRAGLPALGGPRGARTRARAGDQRAARAAAGRRSRSRSPPRFARKAATTLSAPTCWSSPSRGTSCCTCPAAPPPPRPSWTTPPPPRRPRTADAGGDP